MANSRTSDAMAARQRAAIVTLRADAVTIDVVTALRAVGVDPLLLKGPSFSELLYPRGGRTYTDSDVLVNPRDRDRARAAISRLGFVSTQQDYARIERDDESETFVRKASRRGWAAVDLHWNLHLAGDADRTWSCLTAERVPMALGGAVVDVLSVPARAMHVAMHAAQHGIHGPQRFDAGNQTGEDLRRAVVMLDADTWRRARDIAQTIDALSAFAYGLRLTPRGAEIADALLLPEDRPDLSKFRKPFETARGATSLHRLSSATSTRERIAITMRMAVPSRARVRRVADSRVGESSLAGAYLEYWWDALRSLPAAVTDMRALRRHQRAEGNKADESAD